MRLRRLGGALTLVAALLVPVSVAAPADAVVYDPLAVAYSGQVSGDFEITGNSVVVCPTAAGTPRTECLAASRRENTFNNNRFAMTYADVDSDPSTYNSSTGSVTIPAGSRIAKAQLHWAGNRAGQQCGIGDPGSYPPGSPQTQPVRMSVDGAAATSVAPTSYTTDTSSVGYYSADADVTSLLASFPSGRAVPITVANVFTAAGSGCFGGWSLVVVHTDDDPACGVQRRQVVLFEGHVRQGTSDPSVDVTISGIRVDGGPARVGVTAYEGDNGSTGDSMLVNNAALADPATGSTSNLFNSSAAGEVAPAYPNNFSVDAKRVTVPTGVVAPGDTSAVISFPPTNDTYLLQSLAASVPVPALCLEKSVSPAVARAGDPLTWTITARNPTTSSALGVVVDDPAVASCGRTLGTLAAGGSTTYTCTSVAGTDLTNVATTTGTGLGGTQLSASGAAAVDVIDPAIGVTVAPDRATVPPDGDVTWTVTVTNSGDSPLDRIDVADTVVPRCARTGLGPLAAGGTTTYTCTSAVASDTTHTIVVVGTDLTGRPVTDDDDATVTVERAGLRLTKVADVERAAPGDIITWTLELTNTGGVPLLDAATTDSAARGCDRTFATVAVGAAESWTCTTTAGEADETNRADATAATPAGQDLTDSAGATVDVTEPDAEVEISTTPEQPEQGSTVDVVIDVDNTGDVELDDGTIEVTGAPGCDEDGFSAAPGESTRITCTIEVEKSVTLQAHVELQPVLDDQPAGPPIRVSASLVVRAAPAATSGALPATGTSRSALPLGVLGLLLLGGGTWLVRRSRIQGVS